MNAWEGSYAQVVFDNSYLPLDLFMFLWTSIEEPDYEIVLPGFFEPVGSSVVKHFVESNRLHH
jgi:hypothetical protein